MDSDETKKWLHQRELELTPEEVSAAEAEKARFEALKALGRVANVTGFVETPEKILEKMFAGFTSLLELRMDPDMLDGALSVQSERLHGLMLFFRTRERAHPNPRNEETARKCEEVRSSIEAERLKALEGAKSGLGAIQQELESLRRDIVEMWAKEDERRADEVKGVE